MKGERIFACILFVLIAATAVWQRSYGCVTYCIGMFVLVIADDIVGAIRNRQL